MEWIITESTLTTFPGLLFILAALAFPLLGALVGYLEAPSKPVPDRISTAASEARSTRLGRSLGQNRAQRQGERL